MQASMAGPPEHEAATNSMSASVSLVDCTEPDYVERCLAEESIFGHVGLYGERVRGIEPPLQAWEARVLPLNYTREGRKLTL